MGAFMKKYGHVMAALALIVTTITANSACVWITHQEPLPDAAKKLRKF